MSTLLQVPVESIRHRPDARHRSDKALTELSESIEANGLINPITVRPLGDGYEVIAGSHRLQACELLSLSHIACIIMEVDDLHAELLSIDENLRRTELSPTDHAMQTARRKAIYEELHPESVRGSPGVSRQVGDTRERSSIERFTAETAAVAGRSERAVQRDAERGEKIVPEALAEVRGTPLDRGVYLDRLKRVEPAEQVATVRRDLEQSRRGGIAGQYVKSASAPAQAAARPDNPRLFARFIEIADEIEEMSAAALIDGAGRQRAVLGQRASGIADRMSTIMEGLDQ